MRLTYKNIFDAITGKREAKRLAAETARRIKERDETERLKARVLDILRFDPATGKFFWRKDKGTARAGAEAGCVRPNGYRSLNIDRKRYLCHRLVWLVTNGTMPKNVIDHIDGDRTNNRPENLRDVEHYVNIHNQLRPRPNNTSGYKGVYWSRQHGKYAAQIMIKRKHIHLGLFDDPEIASKAYWKAKEQFKACA